MEKRVQLETRVRYIRTGFLVGLFGCWFSLDLNVIVCGIMKICKNLIYSSLLSITQTYFVSKNFIQSNIIYNLDF